MRNRFRILAVLLALPLLFSCATTRDTTSGNFATIHGSAEEETAGFEFAGHTAPETSGTGSASASHSASANDGANQGSPSTPPAVRVSELRSATASEEAQASGAGINPTPFAPAPLDPIWGLGTLTALLGAFTLCLYAAKFKSR